jgi:tRNA A37 N6-isopentenylltransferase MiaA
MKYLITIIGPTAIGKTSLSIVLANTSNAKSFPATVDSFQGNDNWDSSAKQIRA